MLPNGSHGRGPANFFIQGQDVVVTDLDNNFVTILKDALDNSSVKNAVKVNR